MIVIIFTSLISLLEIGLLHLNLISKSINTSILTPITGRYTHQVQTFAFVYCEKKGVV